MVTNLQQNISKLLRLQDDQRDISDVMAAMKKEISLVKLEALTSLIDSDTNGLKKLADSLSINAICKASAQQDQSHIV